MDYLGIDISKASIDAALLIGEKIKHKKCSSELDRCICALFRALSMGGGFEPEGLTIKLLDGH